MDKDKFLASGLLQQYALGLTDEEESAQVEEYLRAYPEVRDELNNLHHALDSYAEEMNLPKRQKGKTLRSGIGKKSEKSGKNQFVTVQRAWFILLLLMMVTGLSTSIYFYSRNLRLRHHLETSEAKAANWHERFTEERTDHGSLSLDLDFIQHEHTKHIPIDSNHSTVGNAIVYWNPLEERAMIQLLDYRSHMDVEELYLWNIGANEHSKITPLEKIPARLQAIPFFTDIHQLRICGNNPSEYLVGGNTNIYPN